MRDNVASGITAGVIAGAIGAIFSHSLFLVGVTAMSSVHLAAALVVRDVMHLTPAGFFWSLFAHEVGAAFFGVLLAALFVATGKDYWALKGFGLGVVYCLLTHSIVFPVVRQDVEFWPNAATTGSMFTTHGLIGFLTAYILARRLMVEPD